MNPAWLRDIFDANQGSLGMLDPQPVADTWSDFAMGDGELRPYIRGQAWFRIYRELLSDHDNNRSNDVDYGILGGVPAAIAARSYDTVALYDPNDDLMRWRPNRSYQNGDMVWTEKVTGATGRSYRCIAPGTSSPGGRPTGTGTSSDGALVWSYVADAPAPSDPPLRNYSVFIIACGAGSSRGFRWWSLPGNDPRRALEPVTASESGLFPNEAVFNLARQGEVIRWFRVEHSPRVHPGFGEMLKNVQYRNHTTGSGSDRGYPWLSSPSTPGNNRDRSGMSNSGDDLGGVGGSLVRPTSMGYMQGTDINENDGNPYIPLSRGGSITWLQRLDQEPIKW